MTPMDSIAIDAGTVLTVLVTWTGVLLGLIKVLLVRAMRDIDARITKVVQAHQDVGADVQRLDADLKRLQAELPIHYQRREDAIREYTVMLARVDAVGHRLDQSIRRDDYVRDVSVLHAKIDALVGRIDRLMEDRHEND